jgi:hypothetical protein
MGRSSAIGRHGTTLSARMWRKPAPWILFATLSLLALIAAAWHFASAFPLVSIDLRMDRGDALERARALATEHRLGPPGFRQAATFGGDDEVQTYVELEAGGKDAFAAMIRNGRYAPYSWRVRHFREHDPNETWIRFTPAGARYGFVERLPETAAGPRLTPTDARAIAERGAAAWNVVLSEYVLVEQAQEDKPGHRVDHTLVYERPDRIGEGRYRVRLVVAGDRLVEVTRFVRVPEAFGRRYQQMRSANEAIGFGSGIALLLLYGVGGIVIGLFVLLRQRWVLWRPALRWGLVVAGLQVLSTLNQWPLAWLQYDTALATTNFVVQQATSVIAAAVAMTVAFTLSFMAAESLSRRAFPHHPQLWRVWSREAGGSRAVLGRTAGAYLLVAIFFAYEVALYLLASRWLGWWTPSDALVHPDVLATYMPWLSAIAPSVQAGFWEECLFRAVPLAGAALIGDRFGHRRAFIVAGMIVQAVVFGAGHAPYPNQPAYARPVELILPSLLFGAVYLRFGLLPGIVLHIAFDTVWFALPLFVSRAPGIAIDRTLVVVLALVPLWIVLWRRRQAGTWTELAPALLNGGWRPEARVEASATDRPARATGAPSAHLGRMVVVAGVAGMVVWAAVFSRQAQEVPPLAVSRTAAIARAADAIRARGVMLDASWRILPAVDGLPGETHLFVRSTAGESAYRQLLGTYLPVPRWRVRVARFEGDIAARAEEWVVVVEPAGGVSRVRHTLPESAAGATLTADEARTLARQAAQARLALDPATLREVSVTPSKLPARTDWLVTFGDRSRPALPQGELRIAVAIAGSEVSDTRQFVHVPEQWQRDLRDRRTVAGVVNAAGIAVIGGLLLGFATITLIAWSRGHAPDGRPLHLFLLLAGVRALDFANGWPARLAGFSTAQPFTLQAVQLAVGLFVAATLVPAILALAAGSVRRSGTRLLSARQDAWLGLGAGGAASGVLALVALVRAQSEPLWPSFAGAETLVPVAGLPLAAVFSFVSRTILLALLFTATNHLSEHWTVHRGRAAALLLGTGLLLGGGAPGPDLLRWAVGGLMAGLLILAAYVVVFRWDLGPLPIAVAVVSALSALRDAVSRPYPGALAGGMLAAVAIGLLAMRIAERRSGDSASDPARSGPALQPAAGTDRSGDA